jgi:hypothetical protein
MMRDIEDWNKKAQKKVWLNYEREKQQKGRGWERDIKEREQEGPYRREEENEIGRNG